jgi:hypothetical protein
VIIFKTQIPNILTGIRRFQQITKFCVSGQQHDRSVEKMPIEWRHATRLETKKPMRTDATHLFLEANFDQGFIISACSEIIIGDIILIFQEPNRRLAMCLADATNM